MEPSDTPAPVDTDTHLSYPSSSSTSAEASSSRSVQQPSNGVTTIRKDRLYVGNLHPTVDEYTLLHVFGKFGKVSKLDFLFHKSGPQKGKPRGYAFVEYSAQEDATKALVGLHDKLVRGRKLVVTFAQQSTIPPPDFSSHRPGGRKGTDTTRPTTLSLIKMHNQPSKTNDKIAALEAKLKQMKESREQAESSSSSASTSGSVLSPSVATAIGILPSKPAQLPRHLSFADSSR